MKVLIVTNSLTGGGAERSMNLLANTLMDFHIKTWLFPLNEGPEDLIKVKAELVPSLGSKVNLSNVWRSINIFRCNVKRVDPDIIILNCDLPEFLGNFLPLKFKCIVVEHARHPWGGRRLIGFLTRVNHLFKKSEFVSVSTALRIWPFNLAPSTTIENCVLEKMPLVGEIKYENVSRLVFVGRLSHLKNPERFLEICSESKLPGVILGIGDLRSDLEDKCKDENIHVDFLGYRVNPWKDFRQGDLLLITSRSEGDCLVIPEALAQRIPLLVEDIPDLRRFELPDLIYCHSISSYVETIQAINDKSQNAPYIDISEVRRIIENRVSTTVAQKWEKFFIDLLKKI